MSVMTTEEYKRAREALIARERSLRSDSVRLGALSDVEARAEQCLREIRKLEAQTIWSMPGDLFPGMEFLTAKETIQQTRLFKILKRMPKGALLHAHMDAMCDVRKLLGFARDEPAMHIKVSRVLDTSNISATLPDFRALTPRETEAAKDSPHISSSAYTPDTWAPLLAVWDGFPSELGGPKAFEDWVVSTLMINPTEAYKTHNTLNKIWQKFQTTFLVARGLIGYEPILERYIRELLLSSIDDGISYVEVRINFYSDFMVRSNGIADFAHREWVEMYGRIVGNVRSEMESQGRGDEFVGSKIIYSTLRHNLTCEQLERNLEDCFQLKKEFPHLIAGFDLVGQEDMGEPLKSFIEPCLRFQQRQKETGIYVPFIFHAGECLGDGNTTDENLYDAILLGTKRIGHGFSLAKHPHLMELCKEKGIVIEVCPISNEILRLTSSIPMHPLSILLNNGVHVALACDDPAIFGNLGLTYDFFQVLVSSEITGLTTLGTMARHSIEHSELGSDEKIVALQKWERRWAAFVKEITEDRI